MRIRAASWEDERISLSRAFERVPAGYGGRRSDSTNCRLTWPIAWKPRNWKMVFYDEERDWWTPPAKLGEPKAFDLIVDPKEQYPQTGMRNTWVPDPAMKIVADFEASLKK